ncbi:MAG: hypothetical protein A3C84_04505 [Candidatus Ryanbacteria bacterium RIFCSPHIGHO2_02_FULL_48_12]|uniref:Response regulatory domain-containing protein n=1 Tax=Candidatus Ryanbacteria bacterium RIFCSPHIGHO2_01_FULL_48_27 TaxID=1802115 RepID=A0A1G2G636_9BACT|nr:MAG: hypothetical protein A2756_02295 [Candidatus Ryanbacteria bacterium RIFCSPHIGHO2_01_FULL_48_27]OGZ49840.1 MAG: hypothetical protein A3C84_04505 [Candidatus Ryanbacteria bacterium RIFCSPHIGHO2_02_FULL_48_12]
MAVKKILVADADHDVRLYVETTLRVPSWSYQIILKEDLLWLAVGLSEGWPDFIIVSGELVAQSIKAFVDNVRRGHPRLPILIMVPKNHNYFGNFEMVYSIQKPFSPLELLEKLQEILTVSCANP